MNNSNSLRKTKIVATIGPASDSPDTLKEMIAAGMNVACLLVLALGLAPDQRLRVLVILQVR